MGICPSNPANNGSNLTRENPYCLTDLDNFPSLSYGYAKWGNLLDASPELQSTDRAGWVTTYPPNLTFNNLTNYINPTTHDLFVNCDLNSLSPATIPATATWTAPSATADGKLSLSPSPCGLNVNANLFRKLRFENSLIDLNGPMGLFGTPVGSATKKAIILIHGWNRASLGNSYESQEFSALVSNLLYAIAGTEWSLILYHWEADADTGGLFNGVGSAYDLVPTSISGTRAAEIAHQHGQHLGELLANLAPNLEKVHFIAHSAGSWAARASARYLAEYPPLGRSGRAPVSQITLLDPFIPNTTGTNSGLGLFEMDSVKVSSNSYKAFDMLTGIYRLENYWAADVTVGTDNPTIWSGGINKRIDIRDVAYCYFY